MTPEPKRGQPGYKSQWKPKHRNARTAKPRETLEARFWKKVQMPEDRSQCWQWIGSKNNHGYGQIHSLEHGDPAMITAHRASLRIHGIDVPHGLVVDHMCHNKGCVNPAHLRFVTQLENCTVLAGRLSPHMINKAKTTCLRGHPFDIIMKRRGKEHRACSICVKIRADRRKAKKEAGNGR